MVITVEVTYSERDYLRAVKFLSRRENRITYGFIALCVVVVGLMLYRANYSELGWWVKPFFGVLFIVFMVLLRMVQLRKPGKHRKNTPLAQGPLVWKLTNESLRLTGQLSDSEIKWEAIVKVRETKRDFFFYTSKRIALFLPKRFLSNES
ncbi:MAG TPA: YcxB family protein, partial [Pyrinomonadaceae bacterium]|nr:YcxB family protein [Pyrinomonadaceae bacterium]